MEESPLKLTTGAFYANSRWKKAMKRPRPMTKQGQAKRATLAAGSGRSPRRRRRRVVPAKRPNAAKMPSS